MTPKVPVTKEVVPLGPAPPPVAPGPPFAVTIDETKQAAVSAGAPLLADPTSATAPAVPPVEAGEAPPLAVREPVEKRKDPLIKEIAPPVPPVPELAKPSPPLVWIVPW